MAGLGRQSTTKERSANGSRKHDCRSATPESESDQFLNNGRDHQLERTIEGEIIPRLMLVHSRVQNGVAEARSGKFEINDDVVVEFTRLVLAHEVSVAYAYVDAMLKQGLTLDALFLELLTGTARHLGDLWKRDDCDFMQVTLGLSRLQQVLRRYGPSFETERDAGKSDLRSLLTPVPGEQHTFGVFMVEEFFRRAGWDVWTAPSTTQDELVGMVAAEWYAVVGFSVSRDDLLDDLTAGIQAVRARSRNQGVCIMVGGRVFIEQPDLVRRVGADATAADGEEAVQLAEALAVSVVAPA